MIYDLRHITTYDYETQVGSAQCAIRLTPRSDDGQYVIGSAIELTPPPSQRRQRDDFFGNCVTRVRIEEPHRQLRVTARARIKIERRKPPACQTTPRWEDVRHRAIDWPNLDAQAPVHFLFPSRLAPLYRPASDYAAQSFASGRPILEGAVDLMTRIRADFRYDPRATLVSTPLSTAFDQRGGVCQDFAHIMIAGLRGLGLPAAYVSGYIRTLPPPGKPRLEGADASHAWVKIWCGAEIGWLGLDPTNALQVHDDHIETAIGRDYADVSPIDGVILSFGAQKLNVSVDVKPLDEPEATISTALSGLPLAQRDLDDA